MLKEVEKVFDTVLYTRTPEAVRSQVLTEDLAGLVIEVGDRPLEERINSRLLKVIGNSVIDPITGEDVRNKFDYKTELGKAESKGANSFYEYLLENPGNLIISIYPSEGPANFKEARINAGYRINDENIEFHGIPSHMNPSSLVGLATKISEWNTQGFQVDSPEGLRELALPVELPEGENPWEFLEEIAPIDSKAWHAIAAGLPLEIKERAKLDASPVAQEMNRRLVFAKNEIDYIRIGAWGERSMQSRGWKLSASACPGLFNSQILAKGISSQNLPSAISRDAFGNARETKWEYHKGNCLNCKKEGIDVGPCSICKSCEKVL